MIKIEHLTKEFKNNENNSVKALSDINLHVEKGDIFGIIGMSGAGKSTLMRCISGLEKPTEGSITLDGENLSKLNGKKLLEKRKQMGIVFQGYNLLMQKNIKRNIAFPLEIGKKDQSEIDKRVEELLKIVSLEDKGNSFPSQLSGGQRQRVAIARALAANPKILLCDEPTSALDPLTTKSILNLLSDINEKLGVTIVIITHELSVVKSICNKVAIINNGTVAEQGITKEVMKNPQSDIGKLLISTIK